MLYFLGLLFDVHWKKMNETKPAEKGHGRD
jgi:hypothetical protein